MFHWLGKSRPQYSCPRTVVDAIGRIGKKAEALEFEILDSQGMNRLPARALDLDVLYKLAVEIRKESVRLQVMLETSTSNVSAEGASVRHS